MAKRSTAHSPWLPDLEVRLANADLTVSASARIAGLARGTVEKIARGEFVKKVTVIKYVGALRVAGYEIDPEGEILAKDAPLQPVPAAEIDPNVYRFPAEKSARTVEERVRKAISHISEADDLIRSLLDESYERKQAFSKVELGALPYKCRDVNLHCEELRSRLERLIASLGD